MSDGRLFLVNDGLYLNVQNERQIWKLLENTYSVTIVSFGKGFEVEEKEFKDASEFYSFLEELDKEENV